MSDISLEIMRSQSFLRAHADLALSLCVTLTGLVVNLAAVAAGIAIA